MFVHYCCSKVLSFHVQLLYSKVCEVTDQHSVSQILGKKCVTVIAGVTLFPFFVLPVLLSPIYIPG